MLGKTRPGYRRKCRYASRGCTCFYYYPGASGARSKALRRRTARRVEERMWRREYAH